MSYSEELEEIKKLRRRIIYPDALLIILWAAGYGVTFVYAPLAPLFGVAIGIHIYKKFKKAAHAPCPQCGEPFGTTAKWPIGFGTLECQNCNLELYQSKKV